ncbi:MAG: RHS repeat-associated core domain-containing protein, partial [Candidatus Nanopelagicales bacterium]|nr:RHS repeat-associated core domain-containing protein [Candidatus Nanopelagicales bacterium]
DSVASSISFDTGSDTWLVRQYGMDPIGRQDTTTETTVTKAKAKTAKQALAQARKANTSAVTTRHYGDGSDSPTWAADTGGTITQWLPGIDGGVAAVITTSGDTSTGVVPVVSPHGDNANTLPLVDDQTSTRVGAGDGTIDGLDLDTWELYDAYGHPINNTVSTSGVANTLGATGSAASTDASSGDRYGWLGAYQRPTSQATGLIQMGARPYNPNTGQFLSTDPIRGGNQNPYTYPVDPVNQADPSGESGVDWRVLYDCEEAGEGNQARCFRLATVSWKIANGAWSQGATNNHVQAVQHIFWSALLTWAFGKTNAKAVLARHEDRMRGVDDLDVLRDEGNNRLGVRFARRHPGVARRYPGDESAGRLNAIDRFFSRKARRGRLYCILGKDEVPWKPRRVARCDGSRDY